MIADRRGLLIRAGKKVAFLSVVGLRRNPGLISVPAEVNTKGNDKNGIFNYLIRHYSLNS